MDDVFADLNAIAEDRYTGRSVVTLPIETIEVEIQDRTHFDDDEIAGLAESIKKQGLISPIVVAPKDDGGYLLVAGECRLRATKLLGQDSIEAFVSDECKDQATKRFVRFQENKKRNKLPFINEALALTTMVNEDGIDKEKICDELNISPAQLRKYLAVANYPKDVIDLAKERLLRTYRDISEAKKVYESGEDAFESFKTHIASGADYKEFEHDDYDKSEPERAETKAKKSDKKPKKADLKSYFKELDSQALLAIICAAKGVPHENFSLESDDDLVVLKEYIQEFKGG